MNHSQFINVIEPIIVRAIPCSPSTPKTTPKATPIKTPTQPTHLRNYNDDANDFDENIVGCIPFLIPTTKQETDMLSFVPPHHSVPTFDYHPYTVQPFQYKHKKPTHGIKIETTERSNIDIKTEHSTTTPPRVILVKKSKNIYTNMNRIDNNDKSKKEKNIGKIIHVRQPTTPKTQSLKQQSPSRRSISDVSCLDIKSEDTVTGLLWTEEDDYTNKDIFRPITHKRINITTKTKSPSSNRTTADLKQKLTPQKNVPQENDRYYTNPYMFVQLNNHDDDSFSLEPTTIVQPTKLQQICQKIEYNSLVIQHSHQMILKLNKIIQQYEYTVIYGGYQSQFGEISGENCDDEGDEFDDRVVHGKKIKEADYNSARQQRIQLLKQLTELEKERQRFDMEWKKAKKADDE